MSSSAGISSRTFFFLWHVSKPSWILYGCQLRFIPLHRTPLSERWETLLRPSFFLKAGFHFMTSLGNVFFVAEIGIHLAIGNVREWLHYGTGFFFFHGEVHVYIYIDSKPLQNQENVFQCEKTSGFWTRFYFDGVLAFFLLSANQISLMTDEALPTQEEMLSSSPLGIWLSFTSFSQVNALFLEPNQGIC